MNEIFQTQLQNAIDLLVKSSAYETPLSDDVIERIGKATEAAGFLNAGAFKELAKTNPISSLLEFCQSAYLLGVNSVVCSAPLIVTTPASIAEQLPFFQYIITLPGWETLVLNHTATAAVDIENQPLISIKCPNLISVVQYFEVGGSNNALVSLDLPSFKDSGIYGMYISGNPLLANIDLPEWIPAALSHVFSNNSLSVETVNNILGRCVASASFTGGGAAIDLSGGTNAAPTGRGILDVATLTGRGATVTTN